MVGEYTPRLCLLSLPVELVRRPWLRLKENRLVLIKLVNRIVRREFLGSGDRRWKFII